jgi:hypothetical protein
MPLPARTSYDSSLTCVLFSLPSFVVMLSYIPSSAHSVTVRVALQTLLAYRQCRVFQKSRCAVPVESS